MNKNWQEAARAKTMKMMMNTIRVTSQIMDLMRMEWMTMMTTILYLPFVARR